MHKGFQDTKCTARRTRVNINMADIVDRATRSRMMSGIRGQDTSPERLIRRELHRRGFRFRLHHSGLPGRPDIVLPKYRVLIQVNGCFWHRHNCHLFKWPATQSQRWRDKLEANVVRDAANLRACESMGWRTLIVWECALKGKTRLPLEEIGAMAECWIREGSDFLEIGG